MACAGRVTGGALESRGVFDGDCFEDETFSDAELPAIDLSEKEFVRCRFIRLVAPESVWKGARLDDCFLEHCDLSRMRPAAMALRGAAFANCRLTGVDWSDLRPNPTVSFEACNLQYASFVNVNLTGARLGNCKLADAQFIESRLVECDFTKSQMAGCRFEDCDLRMANFAEAYGLFVDPTRNKVRDARIAMATAVLLAESFGFKVD